MRTTSYQSSYLYTQWRIHYSPKEIIRIIGSLSWWCGCSVEGKGIVKGILLIWGNDESVNDTMVQPFKLQFYGCRSYFFLALNSNNIHPFGDLTSWNIKKKLCHYSLPGIAEERQHNETRISSQTNFLIIINHSKEYKDLWAFFKHFNDKENIFPLGCTNQMNSTQTDTNNNGGEFLYIQFITNQWK